MPETDTQADPVERALIERARAGDRTALSRVLEPYVATLHRRALARLGDDALAWDCVQETMVRAFRYLASYDTARPFRSWLAAIAANCARDLAHRRSATDLLRVDVASTAPGPEERAATAQRLTWLEFCMGRLPQADLRLFTAVGLKGVSHREAATALQLSEVACRKRYERIKTKLAECLKAHGGEVA
jgi:RNA polymerase sigma factor (sigma-70 family)